MTGRWGAHGADRLADTVQDCSGISALVLEGWCRGLARLPAHPSPPCVLPAPALPGHHPGEWHPHPAGGSAGAEDQVRARLAGGIREGVRVVPCRRLYLDSSPPHPAVPYKPQPSAYLLSSACSAADAEQLVGQVNPTAFQRMQAADDDQLDELREQTGLLKKVCRQKAVYCLKDVRRQVRSRRAGGELAECPARAGAGSRCCMYACRGQLHCITWPDAALAGPSHPPTSPVLPPPNVEDGGEPRHAAAAQPGGAAGGPGPCAGHPGAAGGGIQGGRAVCCRAAPPHGRRGGRPPGGGRTAHCCGWHAAGY